jgi:antirestriction protein
MNNTITEPAVYCGTYAKYNNGSIKGAWIKLSDFDDVSDFWETCKELHKDESDPEYMFQDFEGFPETEYTESGMDFESLIEYAQLDEDERETVDAYIGATGYYLTDIDISKVEHKVVFIEDNTDLSNLATQYGYHMAMSTGEIPDHLSNYIDYEAYGQSWLDNYMVFDGYVFSMD